MHKVSKDTIVYAMSSQNKPVLHVEPGTQILFETWDALHGQVKSADKGFDSLDWNRVNPATGPVYINGVQAGDILSVKIDKIEVAVTNMVAYLTKNEGFTMDDAVMLTSMVADVRICQVVDPKKTVRVEFPKKYLRE